MKAAGEVQNRVMAWSARLARVTLAALIGLPARRRGHFLSSFLVSADLPRQIVGRWDEPKDRRLRDLLLQVQDRVGFLKSSACEATRDSQGRSL